MKTESTFYYVRESALQSIISDIVSFIFITSGFFVNRFYLGGEWYIYVFWMIMFYLFLAVRKDKKFKQFHTNKELIDFLQKEEA